MKDLVLPKTAADFARDFQTAVALCQQGRLDEAKTLCKSILAAVPDHFDVLYLLGVIHLQQSQAAGALGYFKSALKLRPKSFEVLSGLALVHAMLGQLTEALTRYNDMLALRPHDAAALTNRGNVLMNLDRPAEALTSYEKALAISPADADTLNNRGNALKSLKRFEEALASFDKALSLNPRLADALNNRGNVLRDLGRPGEALASCDRALELRPNYAEALSNRGNALMELNQIEEALASYDKALALKPDYAEALYNRGNALADLQRDAEALVSYDRALAMKPDYAEAHGNKGVVLTELGQLEAAAAALETAIAIAPDSPRFYQSLTLCKRFTPGDPHLHAMEHLAHDPSLTADQRIRLHFGLGKAYADIGGHEISAQYLLEGNALKRSQTAYDERAELDVLERMQAAFTGEALRSKAGSREPSPLPIFVIGMPRSGSTLIEQILVSHPMVFGAGQSNDFMRTMEACGRSPVSPENLAHLSSDALRQLGTAYVDRIRAAAPAAVCVIDKTLENFSLLGLIRMALPDARIIHTRRDPMDTCISCFSTLFGDDARLYTYDLSELGRYYSAYEKLMAHWRNVLPESTMLDVQYEEAVADLEGQTRRILDYCGLPWDPRCLDFHKTERAVRTASKAQVREPLFKSSVGRWRAYEAYLGPLLEALAVNNRLPLS